VTTQDFQTRPLRRRSMAALACTLALPWAVHAQSSYPGKPVRVIVPGPAGSSADVIGRYWGERLQRALGQPVVFENRSGAAGNIGTHAVVTSPPDGYTLLYTVGNTTSLNPYIYPKLPYKVEDLVPVLRVLNVPYVMLASASSPYKTLADVVKAAKAQPRKLDYASYGVGGTPHVLMELFANTAGIELSHIPYKDIPLPDVTSGLVPILFEPATTAIPQIKSGRMRGLAATTAKRIGALPDVPTLSETYPGLVAVSWHGLFAPRGTPPEIVNKVATELNRIVQTEEFRSRVRDLGLELVGGTAADLQRYMVDDARLWSKVVKDNHIKAE